MSERDRIGEIQERIRRMETKITLIMARLGVDTQAHKADLQGQALFVPSLDIRLKDMLDAAPESDLMTCFHVIHKGNRIGFFSYDKR